MARGGSKPSAARQKTASASKKPTNAPRDDTTRPREDGGISLHLLQKCLDIFSDALSPGTNDNKTVQEVKGHLFNRDFATAFGKEDYLRVYASRWSPSRALAYLDIFASLETHIRSTRDERDAAVPDGGVRAVCLGGGAGGELVALGSWMSIITGEAPDKEHQNLQVDLVDVADWSAVVQQLRAGLTSPPELSKYASQAKNDANKALVSASALHTDFHQLDVLSPEDARQDEVAGLLERADLVTFMFTLNELYSTSLPATQALLNRMTNSMKAGSHLLVVDSPGSYSTVSLNGAEKKYPMQWLLDHTLLGTKRGSGDDVAKWEKVVEDESRWFRLSKELQYPIALEDMRFQMHLYRRLG